MLAYAANRPVAGKAPSSPPTMLLIISAHVALIALVMSAKMEMTRHQPKDGPIINIPVPPDPPPAGTTVRPQHPQPRPISDPHPYVPLPDPKPVTLDPGPNVDPGSIVTGGPNSFPGFSPKPFAAPVRHEPRLLTNPNELKPPYPESKILSEEEATLQLRLTISESGRVTAVDAVGSADRVFLEAARRYLIAHWRYQPATVDGSAVASSVTISLSFRLDG